MVRISNSRAGMISKIFIDNCEDFKLNSVFKSALATHYNRKKNEILLKKHTESTDKKREDN